VWVSRPVIQGSEVIGLNQPRVDYTHCVNIGKEAIICQYSRRRRGGRCSNSRPQCFNVSIQSRRLVKRARVIQEVVGNVVKSEVGVFLCDTVATYRTFEGGTANEEG
jgi:hypothetical protein